MNRPAASALMIAAAVVGGVSLLAFFAFLIIGPLFEYRFTTSDFAALIADAVLSLAFFLQHSVMVRAGFKARLVPAIPAPCHGAIYAVASGVFLLAVVLLWQQSAVVLWCWHGPLALAPRAASVAAIAGFVWGVRSLRAFDPFGRQAIQAELRGRPQPRSRFTVRGAYLWVRHPLYLCMLVLIWSTPGATLDRLLFDMLWTVWVVAGTRWEEKDLVGEFGDDYRRYQRTVPMLIPWRGPAGRGLSRDAAAGSN